MIKPNLQIDLTGCIRKLQQDFSSRGLMQPVALQEFRTRLEQDLEARREVYRDYLEREWENLFPGVAYSRALLDEKLGDILLEARAEALESFCTEVAKNRSFRIAFRRIFRTWDLRLLVTLGISLVTIPLWLGLFFAPSNLLYFAGGLGLCSNISLLFLLFIKSIYSRRKS